jgi:hypothetical protein
VPGKTIPERAPIGDVFTGVILTLDAASALATEPQAGAEVLASGTFVARYGLRYLGKLHLSVVPGLVALDYGDFLTGEEAWDFLLKQSNLYPRSEVFGYRNDGADEMIVIKLLDISVPPEVLIYADTGAAQPLAKPTALIAPEGAVIPPRLTEYLPRYDSVDEWKAVL